MKATKIALAAAAVIAGSTLYGNHRFEVSRYEPQCDHLPGVCVYGTEKPNSGFSFENKGDLLVRELGAARFHINATYQNNSSSPKSVSIKVPVHTSCEVHGPVQILSNGLVKGCNGDWQDSKFYLASLYGLREIFATPEPISLVCEPWVHRNGTPPCPVRGLVLAAQKKGKKQVIEPKINETDQANKEFCDVRRPRGPGGCKCP